MSTKEIYNSVRDYSDLLETNLMFFKGDIEETFYYGTAWGKGEDQNNHSIVSTNNLIELTEKYRIFTVNGQSSYEDYCTKQRSYLCFYMEEDVFQKIYDKLLNDNSIWVVCNGPIDSKIEQIGSVDPEIDRIILTLDLDEPYTEWNKKHSYRYEDNFSYNKVSNILKKLFYCFIIKKGNLHLTKLSKL